jgi:Protein of unknown function DUF262
VAKGSKSLSEHGSRLTNGPYSASRLVALAPWLGIPHFQRGAVWEDDLHALLLESLLDRTPCGEILIWSPPNASEHGVPLTMDGSPRHLLIDGQQRVTALVSIFRPDLLSDDLEGEKWCLNTEYGRGRGRRIDRFHKDLDPERGKSLYADLLLPLDWLLERLDHIDAHEATSTDRIFAERLRVVLNDPYLPRGLRGLRQDTKDTRLFNVRVLSRERNDLARAVRTYVRINSAGRRVEPEERSYADFVTTDPQIDRALDQVSEAAHPTRENSAKTKKDSRDVRLRRKKEMQFGLPLMIRAIRVVGIYHRGEDYSLARLESIDAKLIGDDCARRRFPQIVESAKDALVSIATSLHRLGCDDFRMLPDTRSLVPIIALLARWGRYFDLNATELDRIVLRLYLAELKPEPLLKLADRVSRTTTAVEAVEAFDEADYRGGLRLETDLETTRTTMDRYSLMLYWLLRKHEPPARDFSYQLNLSRDEDIRGLLQHFGGREAVVDWRAEPVKQHLMPFSKAKNFFDDIREEPGRPGKHDVHGIGNLTYISGKFNAWGYLNDRWLKLGIEGAGGTLEPEPLDNLEAHFLFDDELVHAYDSAFAASESKDWGAGLEAFRRFADRRRKRIAKALRMWDADLWAERPPESHIQPEPLILKWAEREDRILGEFPFGDREVRQALIDLVHAGLRVDARAKAGPATHWRLPGGGRKWLSVEMLNTGPRLKLHQHHSIIHEFPNLRFDDWWEAASNRQALRRVAEVALQGP